MLVTKTDIADAADFDEAAFRAHVEQVNPGVEVLLTSARRGDGVGALLDRAHAVADGAPAHIPVMARRPDDHGHVHVHGHPHAAAAAPAQSGS